MLTRCIFFTLVLLPISEGNEDARRLYDDLLSDYNKLIRPVNNTNDTLTVKFGLILKHAIDVVSKEISQKYQYLRKMLLSVFLQIMNCDFKNGPCWSVHAAFIVIYHEPPWCNVVWIVCILPSWWRHDMQTMSTWLVLWKEVHWWSAWKCFTINILWIDFNLHESVQGC